MKLVLLGNGFDLKNGLLTSYLHFEEGLKINEPNIHEKMSQTFDLQDGDGSDIEDQMSKSSNHIKSVVEEIVENETFVDSYESEELSEPGKNDSNIQYAARYEIENRLLDTKDLSNIVMEGINSIKIPQSIKKNLFTSKKIKIINFNYTTYLKNENILYIHGKANGEEIKFGHDNSKKTKLLVSQGGNEENNGQSIMNSYNKEVEKNIQLMNDYLEGLEITEIEILGMSLGTQDMKYINNLPNVKVIFHGHKDRDLERAKKVFKQCVFIKE